MFDHVFLNASNKRKSEKFYTDALKTIGVKLRMSNPKYSAFGTANHYLFWLHQDKSGATRNMHLAFSAKTRAAVRAFYTAAMANGGKSNGEPGLRPEFEANYYAAYVLDPDGNNVEVVCYAKK